MPEFVESGVQRGEMIVVSVFLEWDEEWNCWKGDGGGEYVVRLRGHEISGTERTASNRRREWQQRPCYMTLVTRKGGNTHSSTTHVNIWEDGTNTDSTHYNINSFSTAKVATVSAVVGPLLHENEGRKTNAGVWRSGWTEVQTESSMRALESIPWQWYQYEFVICQSEWLMRRWWWNDVDGDTMKLTKRGDTHIRRADWDDWNDERLKRIEFERNGQGDRPREMLLFCQRKDWYWVERDGCKEMLLFVLVERRKTKVICRGKKKWDMRPVSWVWDGMIFIRTNDAEGRTRDIWRSRRRRTKSLLFLWSKLECESGEEHPEVAYWKACYWGRENDERQANGGRMMWKCLEDIETEIEERSRPKHQRITR